MFGVIVEIQDPLHGGVYGFVATVEDDGVMLSTEYDYHGDNADVLGDPDERNEEAWAAMDCALGFNAREAAQDSHFSTGFPPFSDRSNVSYATLPHEMALLVRRALVMTAEASKADGAATRGKDNPICTGAETGTGK